MYARISTTAKTRKGTLIALVGWYGPLVSQEEFHDVVQDVHEYANAMRESGKDAFLKIVRVDNDDMGSVPPKEVPGKQALVSPGPKPEDVASFFKELVAIYNAWTGRYDPIVQCHNTTETTSDDTVVLFLRP